MSQTSHGRETVVARRIMAQTYWNVRKLVRDGQFFNASSALQSMSYVLNDWAESDESYEHGRYAEEWLGNLFVQHCEHMRNSWAVLYGYKNEEGEIISTPFEVLYSLRYTEGEGEIGEDDDDDEGDTLDNLLTGF